jgi:enamine deaminase RidA (YjgF/YER057c/UK114 family)
MTLLQPPGWPRPRGYANGVAVDGSGTLVFVAGQIGWAPDGSFPASDLVGQVRMALANALAVLAQAGGRPEHVVRMTWYVVDRADYLASAAEIGEVYRSVMGRVYPAMSAVEVSALMEAEAKVEIEVTAVVPPDEGRTPAAG